MRKKIPNELYWMEKAIEVAMESGSDCPIGSVLVHNGSIIAQAHNRVEKDLDPTAHSEILCIKQACSVLGTKFLDKCTLYCTLEPCPMCFHAIKLAKLGRVVFGAFRNPEYECKPDCVGGIMQQSCSVLLQNYFKSIRNLSSAQRKRD